MFVAHEGTTSAPGLTHSLEVAQIARSVATALGFEPDRPRLSPWPTISVTRRSVNAGEDELQIQMEKYGGFDHNVQTFRVVTKLERRYPGWDGLNLTWETLEGSSSTTARQISWTARPELDRRIRQGLRPAPVDLGLGGGPGGRPRRRHRLQQSRRG